jgi:hypothetical protein
MSLLRKDQGFLNWQAIVTFQLQKDGAGGEAQEEEGG